MSHIIKKELKEAGRIELVKMFCKDEESAILISDFITIKDYLDIIDMWGIDEVHKDNKAISNISPSMSVGELEDFLSDYEGSNIYLDIKDLRGKGVKFKYYLEGLRGSGNTEVVTLE